MADTPAALVGPELLYTGAFTPSPSFLLVGPLQDALDRYTGGDYAGRVRGFTKEQATATSPKVPVFRRVRLIRDRDGMLVREAWSNPTTGAFEFRYINSIDAYTVLSYDHTGNFRAVVADRIATEPMP